MSRRFVHHWPAGLFALSFGIGCSSSSDETQTITSTPEAYCTTACAQAHDCNDAVDAAACRSSCRADLAARPKFRPDFLGYVAGCVESATCPSVSATRKCENEAQARLATSTYGARFCSTFVTAGTKCDPTVTKYPEARCLEAAKTYDDSALESANECLAKSCATLEACLATALPDASL